MNWKKINERYPKAFLEWVRVYMKDKYITSAVVENLTVRLGYEKSGFSYAHINRMDEEVYKLPYYFDTLGIEIESSKYSCRVTDRTLQNKYFLGYKDGRLSATIAGAEKAFEIRDAQLNNN
jgi:hypothetical protein